MNNVLVCVSGLTPQIVTESFYCLSVQQKIKIDEVYVLTTKRGKKVIEGIDDGKFTPNNKLIDELKEMCEQLNLAIPKFGLTDKHIIVAKEESIELSDIRSDKDNILFPNKVAEFIKEKTTDPANILYCSISGGRKTMSVHLANALTMFGRENDKLFHVLTSEENEYQGFYPRTIKEDKALVFSQIPFVRLRSIISSSLSKKEFLTKSYSQFVEYTQTQLSIISDETKLLLNTLTREISYNEKTIKLEPLQFAIYFKLAERTNLPNKPFSIMELSSPGFGKEVKEYLDEYIPSYHLVETMISPWWKKGFDAESFRSKRSKINNRLKLLFNDPNYYNLFKIQSNKNYGNSTYSIKANKNKISIIYKD